MANFNQKNDPRSIQLENSSGLVIDPAENIDVKKYSYSDTFVDESYEYYLFIDANGAWYILRLDITDTARYTKGASAYPTSLAECQALTYDYFNNVF